MRTLYRTRLGPTIRVTKLEFNFLQDERKRAMRDIKKKVMSDPELGKTLQDLKPAKLRINGRKRDGSLSATIRIQGAPGHRDYIRHVLCAASIGSTESRDLYLRLAVNQA